MKDHEFEIYKLAVEFVNNNNGFLSRDLSRESHKLDVANKILESFDLFKMVWEKRDDKEFRMEVQDD